MASTGHLWHNFEWRLPFKLHIKENVAGCFFFLPFFSFFKILIFGVIKPSENILSVTNHSPCICECIHSMVWGMKTSNKAIKCALWTGWKLQDSATAVHNRKSHNCGCESWLLWGIFNVSFASHDFTQHSKLSVKPLVSLKYIICARLDIEIMSICLKEVTILPKIYIFQWFCLLINSFHFR